MSKRCSKCLLFLSVDEYSPKASGLNKTCDLCLDRSRLSREYSRTGGPKYIVYQTSINPELFTVIYEPFGEKVFEQPLTLQRADAICASLNNQHERKIKTV